MVLSHVMFCISFVVVTVKARTQGFFNREGGGRAGPRRDPMGGVLEGDLPADPARRDGKAALSFALSIDDYVITSFVAGQTVSFPIWVFGWPSASRRR